NNFIRQMDRQTIIAEIRRTAAANGGKPLGRLRLEAETGIRQQDWMKFWSRFADAQREAGLEPNEPTSAYDEGLLLRRLVELVRELGRFPTQADRRMKAHADPTFPSLRTLDKRLGSKNDMIAKVAAFCKQQPDYGDVLQWCQVEVKPETSPGKPDTSNDG